MTKRRVEHKLEEHEEILESLTPEERLKLYIQAASEGKTEWMDRLIETCPRHRYQISDPRFMIRRQNAAVLSLQAMYDLHTTVLAYDSTKQTDDAVLSRDLGTEEPVADEEIAASERRVERFVTLYALLYKYYHGYRRFANSILNIELETWVGVHPESELVLGETMQVLETADWRTRAEEKVNDSELDPGDDEWTTLDELAQQHCESLTYLWTDAVNDL